MQDLESEKIFINWFVVQLYLDLFKYTKQTKQFMQIKDLQAGYNKVNWISILVL